MLYPSTVPLAHRIGADTTNPVPAAGVCAVLDTMRASGIFPIVRIVVLNDPLLASTIREWAVQRRSDGTQMQAGYDNGVRSGILWNASSMYTVDALKPAVFSADEEASPHQH